MASRGILVPLMQVRAPIKSATITASQHLITQIRTKTTVTSPSALAYKVIHQRIDPLRNHDSPPSWSAQEAVSNILYETPPPSSAPNKRHILNCLVQNEPGVLSRVSGILAARGFNIDSLVVCHTEIEDLSRMTIVLSGQDSIVEQARRQLEDLVPVWAVLDYTYSPLVQRELLLAKINILGPEYFEELQAHHREISTSRDNTILSKQQQENEQHYRAEQNKYHPRRMPISEALRHKHEHLKSITYLAHQFGGKILDISTNSCIVEISAKSDRIDSFMKLIAPFGILESARTGLMALPRSPLYGPNENEETTETDEILDSGVLPPS